jgi:hypothetical protein
MKPILFSTSMVQAILEGRKSMTRRVINCIGNEVHIDKLLCDWPLSESPRIIDNVLHWQLQTDVDDDRTFKFECPYGKPGDILWVKETWRNRWGMAYANYGTGQAYLIDDVREIEYKAGGNGFFMKGCNLCPDEPTVKWYEWSKWRSSRFMPRSAARIFLKVKDIRVERLQDITEEDAKAEGVGFCCPSQRHAGWNDRWISGYCHDCKHHDPMTGKRPTCYHDNEDETRFRWSCGCNSSFELRDDNIPEPYRFKFAFVWDEPSKVPFWDQNPFVWVIEFERCEVTQ